MAQFIRSNAWNYGGNFANQDLLWYAKGVGVMQARALDDKNSWWFYAAIHGEYITKNNTKPLGWGHLLTPPQVPTTPLPPQKDQDLYWNQCQHQSWYFSPWHRGYLVALEAQVRAAVVDLGGPSTWALPYWNYFGPGNEYEMPPAFAEQNLPNGDSNPLFVTARYGPSKDGNIFIKIGRLDASRACQSNNLYTGSAPRITPPPGYGGPNTGFSHGGEISGNLESNPHNLVHNYVGGLMGFPGTAALDPIFYLHHANIDRMWAVWNADGNSNPNDDNWLNGPPATGNRAFVMPLPNGSSWVYTPNDVKDLSQLDYTYDELPATPPAELPGAVLIRRLIRLTAAPAARPLGGSMDREVDSELLGTHDEALQIKSSGARATVRLDTDVRRKVSESLAAASETAQPDGVYLQLENVRGTIDAHILSVYVNEHPAGAVGLFGLMGASEEDDQHGGGGLTFALDITEIIDTLHIDDALEVESLDVRIVPSDAVQDDEDLRVGRVSIYRQGYR